MACAGSTLPPFVQVMKSDAMLALTEPFVRRATCYLAPPAARARARVGPKGRVDNSPALQRRVQDERNESPEGTTEIRPCSAVPHGTLSVHRGFPALKRRAIFSRPFGTRSTSRKTNS